jgi:hypothetical protein
MLLYSTAWRLPWQSLSRAKLPATMWWRANAVMPPCGGSPSRLGSSIIVSSCLWCHSPLQHSSITALGPYSELEAAGRLPSIKSKEAAATDNPEEAEGSEDAAIVIATPFAKQASGAVQRLPSLRQMSFKCKCTRPTLSTRASNPERMMSIQFLGGWCMGASKAPTASACQHCLITLVLQAPPDYLGSAGTA